LTQLSVNVFIGIHVFTFLTGYHQAKYILHKTQKAIHKIAF